jgi:hypothetical protein
MFTRFRPTNSVLAGEVDVLAIARRRSYPYTKAQAAGASWAISWQCNDRRTRLTVVAASPAPGVKLFGADGIF